MQTRAGPSMCPQNVLAIPLLDFASPVVCGGGPPPANYSVPWARRRSQGGSPPPLQTTAPVLVGTPFLLATAVVCWGWCPLPCKLQRALGPPSFAGGVPPPLQTTALVCPYYLQPFFGSKGFVPWARRPKGIVPWARRPKGSSGKIPHIAGCPFWTG